MFQELAQVNHGLHGIIAIPGVLVAQRNAKVHVNEQIVQVYESLGGPRRVRMIVLLPNGRRDICVFGIAAKLDSFLRDLRVLRSCS